MSIVRNIGTLFVLIPFLFSASGILVIHSHCTCTGKNQVSLYLSPETCGEILEDHNHLFTYHSEDLALCCNHQEHGHNRNCSEEDECSDCGCDSPVARFYQVDQQFTDEKVSLHKIQVCKEIYGFALTEDIIENDGLKAVTSSWFNDPPPLISSTGIYIYVICQIKIPQIA